MKNQLTRTNTDVSLKRQIYDLMLKEILIGKYQPGIPFTEKELVEKYQVSKSPIREALIELCSEGILRSIPRFGYEVLKVSDSEMRNAKEYRIILECGALEMYWDRLTKEAIEQIEESQHSPEGEQDILTHWSRNCKFHLDLMASYGNEYNYAALSSVLRLMTRAYVQFQMDRWKQTKFEGRARFHRDVLQCIREGNKEQAVDLLKKDIEGFVIA